jgi:hypothetical protein
LPPLDELFPIYGCRVELEAFRPWRCLTNGWHPHRRRLRPGIVGPLQIMVHIAGELDIADPEGLAMIGMDGGK